MKTIHNRLIFAIILLIAFPLYTLSLLSLDYSFAGAGFSPFKTSSPLQTAYYSIIGFILLAILILYDVHNRNTNLRELIHIPPIIGLSFLVLFSMDSRQVLQYLPYLQVFLFDDFGSLFLFGGLLTVYLIYLGTDILHIPDDTTNGSIGISLHLILVVFCGPFLLGPVFFFGISVCLSLGLDIFPYYGEGLIGSLLVVSVLLGAYTTNRILNYLEHNDFSFISSIKPNQGFRVIFEFITIYICTAAGFSIIGGLVTDGVPLADLIPF
ncbi:hypothetical protein EU528_14330, partial [Candidatus Thorarchaeota archaeon]